MKRVSILFSMLLVFGLVLAACANEPNNGLNDTGVLEETQDGALPETGLGDDQEGELPDTGLEETPLIEETEAITATEEVIETEAVTDTPEATETEAAAATPMATATEESAAPPPAEGTVQATEPSVTGAAQIAGDRQALTRLSTLVGFEVRDVNGETIGTAEDYIVNTCEAHIVYIVTSADAAQAGETGEVAQAGRMLIPFEAVTVNGGTLDADQNAIILQLEAGQISDAPTFEEPLDLSTTEWETEVRDYWSGLVNLSRLSTECRVPPAPIGQQEQTGQDQTPTAEGAEGLVSVHKIAFASDLMGAELQDGNENALGTIEDAYIEPESGQVFFVVVSLSDGGTVLVPVRAINLPDRAQESEDVNVFVLLVDNQVLTNAPAIDSVDAAFSAEAQADVDSARAYWSEYVVLDGEAGAGAETETESETDSQ